MNGNHIYSVTNLQRECVKRTLQHPVGAIVERSKRRDVTVSTYQDERGLKELGWKNLGWS